MTEMTTDATVHKSITVKTSVERAFAIFTSEIDSWWPRSHHIGKSPMKKVIVESAAGGRCFTEQADGTDCDWGRVLVWEPPHRFVMAWQIDARWQYEPELANCSEVEVRFTPAAGGATRVDLDHRHFERHGAGGDTIRTAVGSPGGWGSLLELYASRIEPVEPGQERDPETARRAS
jgi:uncharacterized protein YndB with AHSA1/START domain